MYKGARSEGIPGSPFTSISFSGPRMAPRASRIPPCPLPLSYTRYLLGAESLLPTHSPALHTEGQEQDSGSVLVYSLSVITVARTPKAGQETQQNLLSLPSALGSASRPSLGPSQAVTWQWLILFPAQMACHVPQRRKLYAVIQLGYMITSPTGPAFSQWFRKQVTLLYQGGWPPFGISARVEGPPCVAAHSWYELLCKPTGLHPQNSARAIFLPVALILGKEPPPPSLGGVPEAEGPL